MRKRRLLATILIVLLGCRADSGKARSQPSPSAGVSDASATLDTATKDLASPDWQRRRDAAEQLGQLGDRSATTVPLLMEILEKDPSDPVRATAARVLGNVKDLRALSALTRALGDKSDDVRGEAANALGRLGPSAAPAIPALIEGLRAENMDTFPRCIGGSASALASIGPPAIPALVEAGSDRIHYSLVEQALAGMGPSVLPVLGEMLAAGGAKAETAAVAVRLMGPPAAPALPSLVAASRNGKIEFMFFKYAVQALGPSAKAAVPRLIELLGSARGADRCRVAEALKAVKHAEASVLQALRSAAEKEQGTLARKCILDVTKSLEQGTR